MAPHKLKINIKGSKLDEAVCTLYLSVGHFKDLTSVVISEQAQRDGDGVRPGEELCGLRPRQHGPGGQENQRRPLRSQHNGGEDLLFESIDQCFNPGSESEKGIIPLLIIVIPFAVCVYEI